MRLCEPDFYLHRQSLLHQVDAASADRVVRGMIAEFHQSSDKHHDKPTEFIYP
jgi:hypothetical protein